MNPNNTVQEILSTDMLQKLSDKAGKAFEAYRDKLRHMLEDTHDKMLCDYLIEQGWTPPERYYEND